MKKIYIIFIVIILLIISVIAYFLSNTTKISPRSSTIIPTAVSNNSNFYTPSIIPSPTSENISPLIQSISLTPSASPTPTITAQQLQQQRIGQFQNDEAFAQEQKIQQQQYPWLSSLPAPTDLYSVYFEVRTQTFIADIYTSDPQTISQLKVQIVNDLQKIVPNFQKYPLKWQIKPY